MIEKIKTSLEYLYVVFGIISFIIIGNIIEFMVIKTLEVYMLIVPYNHNIHTE